MADEHDKFNGLNEESDPLLGNREPVPTVHFQTCSPRPHENGLRERRNDLPQFVTVRGGAYFFLPSIRALKILCDRRLMRAQFVPFVLLCG